MRWLDSITDSVESEQAPGDSEGQGSLVCCSPWGHKGPHGHGIAIEQEQFE